MAPPGFRVLRHRKEFILREPVYHGKVIVGLSLCKQGRPIGSGGTELHPH